MILLPPPLQPPHYKSQCAKQQIDCHITDQYTEIQMLLQNCSCLASVVNDIIWTPQLIKNMVIHSSLLITLHVMTTDLIILEYKQYAQTFHVYIKRAAEKTV